MDDSVDVSPSAHELPGHGINVRLVVDVELEDVGRAARELSGNALGQSARAAERGEHDLGPRLLRHLRDGERDAVVGEDTGDEQLLAFEEHAGGASCADGTDAHRGRARLKITP